MPNLESQLIPTIQYANMEYDLNLSIECRICNAFYLVGFLEGALTVLIPDYDKYEIEIFTQNLIEKYAPKIYNDYHNELKEVIKNGEC